MITRKELLFCKSLDGIDIYRYKPTVGHWFLDSWKGFEEDSEKRTRRQRIRMFLEWLWGGYCIYYAALQDELVGYVLVASGGRRIVCSKRTDIVLGPYYTLSERRGSGLMTKMIKIVLHDLGIVYNSAYCYIKKDNIPSIKVATKCGFEEIGQAEMKGMLRKLHLTSNPTARFYIFRYTKK